MFATAITQFENGNLVVGFQLIDEQRKPAIIHAVVVEDHLSEKEIRASFQLAAKTITESRTDCGLTAEVVKVAGDTAMVFVGLLPRYDSSRYPPFRPA